MLAQLLRENPARADPHAYTTPASVFNTLAVFTPDSDPDPTASPSPAVAPAPAPAPALLTRPIPVTQLHRLDPLVPDDAPATHQGRIAAPDSCDNLAAPTLAPASNPALATGPPDEVDAYPSRVRSLERMPRVLERAPLRVGSLERNSRPSGAPPLFRQQSVPASPPRARRERDVGQFSVQGSLNAQLAASVLNKMRQQPEPPLVEEIYDFGGDNVRSCVAIAQRSGGRRGRRVASHLAPPYGPSGPASGPQCAALGPPGPLIAADQVIASMNWRKSKFCLYFLLQLVP